MRLNTVSPDQPLLSAVCRRFSGSLLSSTRQNMGFSSRAWLSLYPMDESRAGLTNFKRPFPSHIKAGSAMLLTSNVYWRNSRSPASIPWRAIKNKPNNRVIHNARTSLLPFKDQPDKAYPPSRKEVKKTIPDCKPLLMAVSTLLMTFRSFANRIWLLFVAGLSAILVSGCLMTGL